MNTLIYQRNKYHNIPLWVIMNTLTFGQISKMFEFLPQNIQGTVCQDFGNVKKNEMIKYLKVLTLYRNVCAHNERLFSYHTYIDIPDTLLHKKLKISKMVQNTFMEKMTYSVLLLLFAIYFQGQILCYLKSNYYTFSGSTKNRIQILS